MQLQNKYKKINKNNKNINNNNSDLNLKKKKILHMCFRKLLTDKSFLKIQSNLIYNNWQENILSHIKQIRAMF